MRKHMYLLGHQRPMTERHRVAIATAVICLAAIAGIWLGTLIFW